MLLPRVHQPLERRREGVRAVREDVGTRCLQGADFIHLRTRQATQHASLGHSGQDFLSHSSGAPFQSDAKSSAARALTYASNMG